MDSIALTLDALLKRYISNYRLKNDRLPTVNFEPPMPSLCTDLEENEEGDSILFWRPVARASSFSFSDLENSLEIKFPEELISFYGSFWSDIISVNHKSGLNFNLIQVWNEEDENRLKENMLGHVFAKMKNRLSLNYFIGSTDGNEVVCLDHETQLIVLEKPGFGHHHSFDQTLEQFLLDLSPFEH